MPKYELVPVLSETAFLDVQLHIMSRKQQRPGECHDKWCGDVSARLIQRNLYVHH